MVEGPFKGTVLDQWHLTLNGLYPTRLTTADFIYVGGSAFHGLVSGDVVDFYVEGDRLYISKE